MLKDISFLLITSDGRMILNNELLIKKKIAVYIRVSIQNIKKSIIIFINITSLIFQYFEFLLGKKYIFKLQKVVKTYFFTKEIKS